MIVNLWIFKLEVRPVFKTVLPSDAIPFGYGYAFKNVSSMSIVIAPVPFNFIIRWGRDMFYFLAGFWIADKDFKVFNQGVKEGIERQKKLQGMKR